MGLQKIERNSVSDAVYDQLSREILEGRMLAGETLPAERALCQTLGVNRGAVREALKRLSQAGLVQVRHGGGATVLDFRETAGMDLLSGLLFSSDGSINMKVARSVIEMRAAIVCRPLHLELPPPAAMPDAQTRPKVSLANSLPVEPCERKRQSVGDSPKQDCSS